MVQTVTAGGAVARPAPPPFTDPVRVAERVLAQHTTGARRDLPAIRRELDALTQQNPILGEAVRHEVEARLTPVQRGQLASAEYALGAPDGQPLTIAADAMPMGEKWAQPAGSPERQLYDRLDRLWGDGDPRTNDTAAIEAGIGDMIARGLTLAQVEAAPAAGPDDPSLATQLADLTQLALDLTGIVDPTPISDGSNAVISAGRAIGSVFSGEWGQAGGHLINGGLSVVGILPVLGDAAKLGKISRWAETVSNAVGTIARNPAARAALEPVLRRIADAVNAIPAGAIDKVPSGARASLERMRVQLDGLFPGSAAARRLGIPTSKVDEIVAAGRGARPDPTTYLPPSRIADHAEAFESGASRFTSQGTIDKYGLGQADGTSFVMTPAEADRILAEAGGDPRKLEQLLGLPQNQLDAGDLVRVDFPADAMDDLDVRMPSGNEAGANEKWLPGGLLPSGANEAVLDGARARPGQYTTRPVTLP